MQQTKTLEFGIQGSRDSEIQRFRVQGSGFRLLNL